MLSVAKHLMPPMQQYFVYIATNKINTVLYVGMTNNVEHRIYQHSHKTNPGFTSRYNVNKLVYFDSFNTPIEAIAAEKKIKGWTRARKIALIKEGNSEFRDLLG